MTNNSGSWEEFRTPLRILTWILYAAIAFVPLLIAWRLRTVLAPFVIALILALLIEPAIRKLELRGLPRRWSVALISLIFVGIFVLIAIYLIPMIIHQVLSLPQVVREELPAAFSRYQHRWANLVERAHVPDSVQQAIGETLHKAQAALPEKLASFGTALARSAGFVVWIVLIPLVTIYLLGDMDRIGRKAAYLAPKRQRERIAQVGSEIADVFLGWVRGMALVSTGNGIMVGLSLAVLRVPYALIVGIVAILLYPVPYIGPWLTAIIAFILAAATVGIAKAAIAVLVVIAFNTIFDSFITPRVVGGKVGLHPVVSLLALMVGAELFGIIGMLVALPVAASIQILLVHAIPRLGTVPPDGEAPSGTQKRK